MLEVYPTLWRRGALSRIIRFFLYPPMPDTFPQRRVLPTLLLLIVAASGGVRQPLHLCHFAGFALVLGGVVLTSRR